MTGTDGSPRYCRSGCRVVVTDEFLREVADASFAMAEGTLAAAPATGLADGDPITLTGSGLMATYDGPLFWIVETGEWVAAQCDAALLNEPTLFGLFTHCASAGIAPVTVPGSTLSQPVEAQARLDRILGGTTDCTAAPGTCLAVLTRLEQDGTLTLHTTPLAFAT